MWKWTVNGWSLGQRLAADLILQPWWIAWTVSALLLLRHIWPLHFEGKGCIPLVNVRVYLHDCMCVLNAVEVYGQHCMDTIVCTDVLTTSWVDICGKGVYIETFLLTDKQGFTVMNDICLFTQLGYDRCQLTGGTDVSSHSWDMTDASWRQVCWRCV